MSIRPIRVLRALGLLGALLVCSTVGAALWVTVEHFPGRACAEAIAPTLHAALPRGRTWSGNGPSDPYWRPRELTVTDSTGVPMRHPVALFSAVGPLVPKTAFVLLSWHLGMCVVLLVAATLVGRPEHVRRALLDEGAIPLCRVYLHAALISVPLAVVFPALGQLAWLTWWKFDRFDALGSFDAPAAAAARNGFPVALGWFGVGGLWAGVILTHAMVVAWAVGKAARSDPGLRRRLAVLCSACGYPRLQSGRTCPECGSDYQEPMFEFRVIPWGVSSHRPLSRWAARAGLALLLLMLWMWPLVAAFPGRVLPEEWVLRMPF